MAGADCQCRMANLRIVWNHLSSLLQAFPESSAQGMPESDVPSRMRSYSFVPFALTRLSQRQPIPK